MFDGAVEFVIRALADGEFFSRCNNSVLFAYQFVRGPEEVRKVIESMAERGVALFLAPVNVPVQAGREYVVVGCLGERLFNVLSIKGGGV
ncbi:MAG: hypothetical protein C4584_02555 [Armatimonadetes bacterium]|nr:MAG: hypothetical protein C4584_02555 [Armatimonadota bacterium]